MSKSIDFLSCEVFYIYYFSDLIAVKLDCVSNTAVDVDIFINFVAEFKAKSGLCFDSQVTGVWRTKQSSASF